MSIHTNYGVASTSGENDAQDFGSVQEGHLINT